MTRRFHPACPVPPFGEVMLVQCPHRDTEDLAPSASWAAVETGEVAASGGGSLLQAWPPADSGTSTHTHTLDSLEHHGPRPIPTDVDSPHTAGPPAHLSTCGAAVGAVGAVGGGAQLMLLLPSSLALASSTPALCAFPGGGVATYHPVCALCPVWPGCSQKARRCICKVRRGP